MTLPSAVVNEIGLAWRGSAFALLGDGSLNLVDVYEAAVIWDGNERTVEIDTAETEPLVGTGMIYGHDLRIQAIESGMVTIKAIPTM